MKWIAGSSSNRARGLPAMAALVVLNDAATGRPVAILDGGVITAARTAALSGAALRALGPPAGAGSVHAVIVGAGMQGRAHVTMLAAERPGVSIDIVDRHPERARALADDAVRMAGIAAAGVPGDAGSALRVADIVISATALGGVPTLGPRDLAPAALVMPVDYGAYVTADLVAAASVFAVDDVAQFTANRRSGRLAGWPDPTGSLADHLLGRTQRPDGLAVALHQGPGVADVILADAVLRRAVAAGLGVLLPR
jgi:ornithine cyclodeaminase/alanine dehydrogenase-like protein (mu-crystallin family)